MRYYYNKSGRLISVSDSRYRELEQHGAFATSLGCYLLGEILAQDRDMQNNGLLYVRPSLLPKGL